MGEVLLCLWGLALLMCGVMITFKMLNFFCQHTKNYTFKKWVAPLISGLLGGLCIAAGLVLAVLVYSNVGFLREFIDAIGSL